MPGGETANWPREQQGEELQGRGAEQGGHTEQVSSAWVSSLQIPPRSFHHTVSCPAHTWHRPSICQVRSVPEAVVANYPRLGAGNNTIFFSSGSGARSLESECGQGRTPSRSAGGGIFLLQVCLGSWPRRSNLCFHHRPSPLCVCVQISLSLLLERHQPLGLGHTLLKDDFISRSLITSAKTLFPSKVSFTDSGG